MSAPAKPTFAETSFARRKHRTELVARCFFGGMAAAMVIPLLCIVGYVIVQGAPSLSWEFLTTNPRLGGIRGGIWSALVGTIYIVGISLCVSAPIGVLSAVYLNEYAKDNWFTRIVNLAVVNLAGVPSIVHALFGLGAFVYAAGMGNSILSASLTLSIMTLPVIIASTKEALAGRAHQFSRGLLERGRHPLADHPSHRAAELDQRHPDGRHPASQPHCRARRLRSCSRAWSSSRPSRAPACFPTT